MTMNWTTGPSTALLQSVMMASPNGVLVLQAIRGGDGKLIDLYMTLINAVAEQELGCPAVEALGQSFALFFPHLAEKNLLEAYRQVLETGRATQFEIHFNRPGQTAIAWLDISVVRLEKSLLLAYTDITATKNEAKAELWTDRLQKAFDESVSGISVFEAIKDKQGKVNDFKLVMINKAGQRMSGFLHEELLGRTVWEMYPATSINGLFDQYVRVWKTGKPVFTENYYPEYDIWREVKIVRVEQGIMVAFNDITIVKKAQERANQQEQLIDDMLDSMPVGMAVVKPVYRSKEAGEPIFDFRIVKANPALEAVFNQPVSQMAGQLLINSTQSANATDLFRYCVAGAEQGKKQVLELALGNQHQPSWYRVSMTPSGAQLILSFTAIAPPVQSS